MADQRYGICGCGRGRRGALDSLVLGLVNAEAYALDAEATATRPGFLQSVDPRIKVLALVALIVATTATRSLVVLAALFVAAVALAFISRIGPGRLARQVWVGVLIFSGIIVLPAIFLVPGTPIVHLPVVGWAITLQGLRSAAFVVGRAETAATLALLIVLTTPWPHVLKALASLGVPAAAVAVLGMTYRYVFVLIEAARHMMEARRSRIVAPLDGRERRRMLMTAIGMLLAKTFALGSDVHAAMIARGYRGEVRLLHDFHTRPPDWVFLAIALAVPALILGLQP